MTAQSRRVGRYDNIPQAILYMLASVFIFSIVNAIAKWLTDYYAVVEIVFFRNLFGLIPVIWLLHRADGFVAIRESAWGSHILRGALGFGHLALLFWSFSLMPLADATALTFAAPLLVTALSAPLLSEKVGAWRWGAVGLGFIGVLITARPGGEIGFAGGLIGLGSALCYALAMIIVRRMSGTESTALITFNYTVIMTVFAGVASMFVWVTPGWGDLLIFLGIGLIGGVGQYCLSAAYTHAPASATAPFSYTTVIFAMIAGFLVWGDIPTIGLLIGCALVVLAGLIILWREHYRRTPLTADAVARRPPSG